MLVEMRLGKNCDICRYFVTIVIIRNSKRDSEKVQQPLEVLVLGDQTTLTAMNMVGKIP